MAARYEPKNPIDEKGTLDVAAVGLHGALDQQRQQNARHPRSPFARVRRWRSLIGAHPIATGVTAGALFFFAARMISRAFERRRDM